MAVAVGGLRLYDPAAACTAAFSLGVLTLPWLVLAGDGLRGRYQPVGRSLLLVSLGGVLLAALGPFVALAVAPVERAACRWSGTPRRNPDRKSVV